MKTKFIRYTFVNLVQLIKNQLSSISPYLFANINNILNNYDVGCLEGLEHGGRGKAHIDQLYRLIDDFDQLIQYTKKSLTNSN